VRQGLVNAEIKLRVDELSDAYLWLSVRIAAGNMAGSPVFWRTSLLMK